MRKIFALFAALCLVVFIMPLAFAQTAVPAAPQPVLQMLWNYAAPVVDALLTAIAGWIAYRVHLWFNFADEAKTRTALHDAALSALKYVLQQYGIVPDMTTPIPENVIKDAIGYVRDKNPDTAKRAGIDDKGLAEIILSKIPDVISMLTPPAAPAITVKVPAAAVPKAVSRK